MNYVNTSNVTFEQRPSQNEKAQVKKKKNRNHLIESKSVEIFRSTVSACRCVSGRGASVYSENLQDQSVSHI